MSQDYNPNDYNAVISRIDVNLKSISDRLTAIEAGVVKNATSVENRLTVLEQFKWHLAGIIAGISAAVNYFTTKT